MSTILLLLTLPSWLELHSPDEYTFIERTDDFVSVKRGETLLIGKLDKAGNFTPDCRWQGVKIGQPMSGVPVCPVINSRRLGREPVYEYRSGRLIKGELDKEGDFIPDLGSKVTDFKDYRPGKGVPVIYNLPGRFVKKSEIKKGAPAKKQGKD